MAANKFATMLHRNTNKISMILIYAVLEWILIILLLLNSLFSYLIQRFTNYFGLRTPCIWCSRVDHCFGQEKRSHHDLVCDIHAAEISELGYCATHKKLAKNRFMCKDCLFSQCSDDFDEKIAFLSCVAEKTEDDEVNTRCSCCDASLSSDLYPPYLLYNVKTGDEEKDEENGMDEHKILSYVDEGHGAENCVTSPSQVQCKEIEINEEDMEDLTEATEKESVKVNAPDSPTAGMDNLQSTEDGMSPLCTSLLKFENWSNFEDHFLVTIESIDSLALKKENVSEVQKRVDSVGDTSFDSKQETTVNTVKDAVQEKPDVWEPEFEYMNKAETEDSQRMLQPADQAPLTQSTESTPFNDSMFEGIELVMMDSDELTGVEQTMPVVEAHIEPTGTEQTPTTVEREMHDLEVANQTQPCESLMDYSVSGNATDSNTFKDEDNHSSKKEETSIEERPLSIERSGEQHSSQYTEVKTLEEENSTSIYNRTDNHQNLHNKVILEKKESGTEQSLDGSFISELSGGEGSTIEHLKSVLKEERKARCALYEELEEERNANAVAAKQTMEMITRLQEEKATVQMEALQYQRMMDEQSEYDQEALQLLNELVVKVEKEKHDLQMELETSRKKVLHYEAKERRRLKRMSIGELSRTHSASFSNSEDGDHLPVDFDHESVDEEFCNGHPESSNHTPANGVLNLEDMDLDGSKHMSILDESLADFEAEKLSILEKLKELEEKLFTLSDEEGDYFEDIKPVVLFPDEDAQMLKENEDFHGQEIHSNGFSTGLETEHYKENGNMHPDANGANGFHLHTEEESITVVSRKKSPLSNFVAVNKRLAIEEEVENVYERLQALEADREFLKQSISSLKKGDKGMDLLREILQYLRDLRSVELCTRNMSDASLS